MRKVAGPVTAVSETFSAHDLIGWPPIVVGNIGTPLYADSVEVFGVLLQNSEHSENTVLWGNAAHQWMELRPGESVVVSVSNPNLLFVRTDGGSATINWAAFAAEHLV